MVRVSLAVCGLLAAAPSCPDLYSLATHGFTAPTVSAATATAALDAGGVRVNVAFIAQNPNPFPLSISTVDYTVRLNGDVVFVGTQQDPSIAEHSMAIMILSGVIAYGSAAYKSLQSGQSATYDISGVAHVASPAGVPVDVAFDDTGTFIVPGLLPTH
jgi:LEA14-like dessication related protein